MNQNVIELNGKRYDALSGAYLGKSSVVPKHVIDAYSQGKVIDGLIKPLATKPKPEPANTKRVSSTNIDIAAKHQHPKAGHVHAHKPEKSKTLMRHVIKKPEFSLKPALKTVAPAEIMTKPKSTLVHKRSAYNIDPVRKKRAELANRHQAVLHFNPHAKTPILHAVSSQVPVISVQPAPFQPVQALNHAKDRFEAAISRATSHQQPMHKPKASHKRRLINSLAVVGTFLIIGGFIGYLNLPQLELRVASVQAGFGASMPAYAPTGYALENGIQRNGGTISLSFRSGASRYTLTQQSSNWNSQTLLDNTLALSGTHQTVQKNGQTIYIYDNDTNAAWVNAGVRYDLNGNAQLSKDDIVSIATSL